MLYEAKKVLVYLHLSLPSAGVGRTGTFLAIDVELQRARVERVVNPYMYIKIMRDCRNLMVQTEVRA